MSIQLIQQYHAQVEKFICYGGSYQETAVSVETMFTINQLPNTLEGD